MRKKRAPGNVDERASEKYGLTEMSGGGGSSVVFLHGRKMTNNPRLGRYRNWLSMRLLAYEWMG